MAGCSCRCGTLPLPPNRWAHGGQHPIVLIEMTLESGLRLTSRLRITKCQLQVSLRDWRESGIALYARNQPDCVANPLADYLSVEE